MDECQPLALGVFQARNAKMDWTILTVTALQGLAISLGQASLKLNSMSFFQLTKQMQLPLVATIEFFLLGRRLTAQKVLLLIAMTAGRGLHSSTFQLNLSRL